MAMAHSASRLTASVACRVEREVRFQKAKVVEKRLTSAQARELSSSTTSGAMSSPLPTASPQRVKALLSPLPWRHSSRCPPRRPLVVAEDGTLSRIPNWSELSEGEQEIAWRRISKKNEQRLARLREQESEEL